ncbi:MAG: hypothetical protein FJX80_07070 [Bacteroidetes bacterium]|nr:hypothetical protein [Bacteroidota bacterium]
MEVLFVRNYAITIDVKSGKRLSSYCKELKIDFTVIKEVLDQELLVPSELDMNDDEVYLYRVSRCQDKKTGQPNAEIKYVLLRKLTIDEWQVKFKAFLPHYQLFQTPTFYFTKTKRGIITTTYPIGGSVVRYMKIGWIDRLQDGIKSMLIYPGTKFLFFPYDNTRSIRFEGGQMLPLYAFGSNSLDFSPLDFIHKDDIYWGNNFYKNQIPVLNSTYSLQPLNSEFTTILWKKYFKEYRKWLEDQSTLNAHNKFDEKYNDYIEQILYNSNNNPFRKSNDWMDDPENFL